MPGGWRYSYREMFGKDNFFLEIQDHGLEQDKRLTPAGESAVDGPGIPLVVTNDSHYLRREDARAHEILMCIQTGKTMNDPESHALGPSGFLSEIARRDDGAVRRTGRRGESAVGDRRSAAR